MTAPKVIIEQGRHSVFLCGDMGLVHAAISELQVPKQYDRKRRAIAVPVRHSDDLQAVLELRFGADVQIVEAIV